MALRDRAQRIIKSEQNEHTVMCILIIIFSGYTIKIRVLRLDGKRPADLSRSRLKSEHHERSQLQHIKKTKFIPICLVLGYLLHVFKTSRALFEKFPSERKHVGLTRLPSSISINQ